MDSIGVLEEFRGGEVIISPPALGVWQQVERKLLEGFNATLASKQFMRGVGSG